MVRNNVESMNRNWKEKNIFLDLLRLKNRLNLIGCQQGTYMNLLSEKETISLI